MRLGNDEVRGDQRDAAGAIQALLSTNSLAGAAPARPVRCPQLGNECLVEVAIEVPAQVVGKAIDVATELEQGIAGRAADERSNGNPDRVRLRPPALASPGVELLQIPLVEIYLQRPRHKQHATRS